MWTTFLSLASTILIPLLKLIFQAKSKKELSDKEFVAYVLAHQQRRARAGRAAEDANEVLDEALRELEDQESNNL